MVLDLDT
jgi:hypothetical protein